MNDFDTAGKQELLQFFEAFKEREPFYCELVQGGHKLSICIRQDLGTVQHSQANNDPPYMMAVTTSPHDPDDEVVFFIGNEATPLSARYALPLETVKQLIAYFLETGGRSPEHPWEEMRRYRGPVARRSGRARPIPYDAWGNLLSSRFKEVGFR